MPMWQGERRSGHKNSTPRTARVEPSQNQNTTDIAFLRWSLCARPTSSFLRTSNRLAPESDADELTLPTPRPRRSRPRLGPRRPKYRDFRVTMRPAINHATRFQTAFHFLSNVHHYYSRRRTSEGVSSKSEPNLEDQLIH